MSFRAIWLIPALLVLTIVMSGGEGGISHIGHLGGVLVGWLYLRRRDTIGGLLSLSTLKLLSLSVLTRRWRRYRMRKKLRTVDSEEAQQPYKDQDHNDRDLTP